MDSRDPITDEILEPVYEYKQTMLPASLRQKVSVRLVPIFRERAELDVKHTGQVVFRHEPGKYIPMAQRAQPSEVVDAQFTEVGKPALPSPPPRPDLEQLRALAAQLDRDPNRVTRPQGVVLDSMGRPVGSTRPINDPPDDAGPPERPERTLRDSPFRLISERERWTLSNRPVPSTTASRAHSRRALIPERRARRP